MNAEGIVSFDHGANSYFGSGHIPGQQNQEENLHARSLSASSLGNNPCGAGRKALGRVGSWTAAAATERAQLTPGELWAGMGLSSWIKGSWPLYLSMSSHWTQSGPRYSRDFNLKKKKKNCSSAGSYSQRELTAEGCVQAAHPAWGNTFCILEEKLGWQQSTWELYQDWSPTVCFPIASNHVLNHFSNIGPN